MFACLLFLDSIAWARAKKTEVEFPREKLSCEAKELARQDCRLTSHGYNVRLLAKTVAWSDGTWHTVDPMPLNGEAVEWERARFQFMGGWPILQLWLWDKGLGETQVQSLHWYVADAEKRKLTILSEGLVRKRRPEPTEPAVEGSSNSLAKPKLKPAPTQQYLYDGWEPHYVKALPKGDLEWQLSGQKKVISKVKVQAGKEEHGI